MMGGELGDLLIWRFRPWNSAKSGLEANQKAVILTICRCGGKPEAQKRQLDEKPCNKAFNVRAYCSGQQPPEFLYFGGPGAVGLEFGHFAKTLGKALQQLSMERRLGRGKASSGSIGPTCGPATSLAFRR